MANLVSTITGRIYPMPDMNRLNTLAKLITGKNLRLRLSMDAKTASISLRTNEIIIPYWDVPDFMFRFLVAHECAHAIWTSKEESDNQINKKDYSNFWKGIAHRIHNVCEDVRIDKNIQKRLTGLVKDYKESASIIRESPVFNPAKADLDSVAEAVEKAIEEGDESRTISPENQKLNEGFKKMSTFLNECNIYYKTRWDGLSPVPVFTDKKETEFFERMDRTVTEEQVYQLSFDILGYFLDADYIKDKARDKEGLTDFLLALLAMLLSEAGDKVNVNSGNGNYVGSGDGEMIDESDLSEEQKEILRKIKELMTTPGSPYDKGDVSCGTGGGDGYSKAPEVDNFKQHSVVDGYERINSSENYHEPNDVSTARQQMKTDKLFVKANVVARHFNDKSTIVKDDIRHNISSLVRGFELHKKSEEYRNTSYRKTGKIAANRLHAYKTMDDIFRSNEVEYIGDKYGFYVFVDYSGSMQDKIRKVTEHAYIKAMFFKRVGVPFKIFSVGLSIDGLSGSGIVASNNFDGQSSWGGRGVVYELFASDLSKSEINQVYNGMMEGLNSGSCRLGSTPLTNTMMTVRYSVDNFIMGNDIKKFGVIAITDGGDDYGKTGAIQDYVTGQIFQSQTNYFYGHMIKLYKDLFSANFVAIDLEKEHTEGVESEYTAQYNLSKDVIQNREKYMKFAKEFMGSVL